MENWCWFNLTVYIFSFLVTSLLKKLKQQSREALEERRPQLTTALQEVCLELAQKWSAS